MKKRIIPALLAMLMVLSLAGCGKTAASIEFKGAESVSLATLEGIKGTSCGTHDNVLELTASKDCEGELLIDVDGEEVVLNFTFNGKNCTIATEPEMEYTMTIK